MAGEDIVIKAGFDGKQAEKGLDKLRSQSKSFSNELTGRFAALFTATALLDRGLNFVADSFQRISQLGSQAKKAGLSVEDFQRVSNAAQLADVSVSAIAKALREVRKETAAAASGNERSRKSLEDLGFSADEINSGNIKATEVLVRLARAYGLARTEAEKYSVATSVLSDRTGTELIPLLAEGEQALSGAFGRRVVSAEQAAAADQVADSMDTLKQDLGVGAGSLMGDLMEFGGSISMAFRDLKLRSLISEGKQDEAVKYFFSQDGGYSESLKYMAAGGELGKFEDIQRQMFAEFFPELNKQNEAQRMAAAARMENAPAPQPTNPLLGAAAGDSLQAIGGGGYYVAGAALMTDTAARTADAAERTANACERMASGGVGSPPVSR